MNNTAMQSLLRSKLRADSGHCAPDHPSADLLTAYRECTLSTKDRQSLSAHLAICQSCRDILALSSVASESHAVSFQEPRRTTRLRSVLAVCGAVAATLIAICATVPFSLVPKQSPKTAPPSPAAVIRSQSPERVFYASARVVAPTFPIANAGGEKLTWKIERSRRPAVLQVSRDNGKAWKTVQLTAQFEPEFDPKEVAWEGAAVWVRSSRGTVITSLDGGMHWAAQPKP